jgi:predicted lipoprotein with Yx(FWY)xxD motif
VIVDAQGRTLYRFTAEAQGRPVCTGACVDTWPPATVTAAGGLPAHVATVKRPDDGKLQLTYDGHPLYRYSGDSSTADANGEGVGGQWYVVKAGAGGSGGGGSATQDGKRGYGY